MSNYKHYTLDDWIECINLKLEYFDELDGNEMRDLVYFLSNMKQQKENKWIPCSERMPDKENEYLVTTYCGGKYDVETSWWWIYSEGHSEWGEYGVIAWMPLPEEYKAESEDAE